MQVTRVQFVLGILLCAVLSSTAPAQTFPDRPVRIVVPFVPGGTPDVLARAIAAHLASEWGQSVYIENRAGANGNIGAKFVTQADPDGYTLLFTTPGIVSTPFIFKTPPFDVLRDLTPIATSGLVDGYFMLVNPQLPARTVGNFIEYAKSNHVMYGSPGHGNPVHLTTEMFALKAGIKMEHLPFKGSPEAVLALIRGDIQTMLVAPPSVVAMIKEGKVRAIGFTGSRPFSEMPEIPLIRDIVPGFPPSGSWGMFLGPAQMPPAVVEKINADVRRSLVAPAVARIVEKAGYERDNRSAAETAAFLRQQVELAGVQVRAANIQPH